MNHPIYKQLDNFSEYRSESNNLESISKFIRESPHPKEEEILKYLLKGEKYISMMGILWDVIDKETRIGYTSWFTDEVWTWRSDLPYYIRKYHLQLSEEFLIYLENKNWGIE